MIAFFANIFGYVLNFLYELVGNYGLAIILFSILVKIIMLPISIRQKVNNEMKQIQFKYKNDPEKMNQEVMALYKREKMSPFSGCLSAIVQIILLFSVFYLVRSPLTYMKKVDKGVIEKLQEVVQQDGNVSNYKEIAIVNYIGRLKNGEAVSENQQEENKISENTQEAEETTTENQPEDENTEEQKENEVQDANFNINEYLDTAYVNMNFLGLDLSKVPTEDLTDLKVLIIPVLYVISSFISIRISTNMQNKKKQNKEEPVEDGENKDDKEEQKDEYDAMLEANKSMSWFMPLMSISIACIAPLGLALYWLINNILMILERFILDKLIKDDEKEEAENNA